MFAYIGYFKVMALVGSAIASSVTYLSPAAPEIIGVTFLQANIYWYEPVGALIILLDTAICQNRIKFTATK